MSDCCDGTCRRAQPIRILRSELTGRVYAVTRWRPYGDGIEAIEKHDVTADVETLTAPRPTEPRAESAEAEGAGRG